MGECLPVHGAGGEAVEWEHGETTHQAAHKRDQKGFEQKGRDDACRSETKRAHRGDFPAALGNRGIHGVQRAKDGADGHDSRDESAKNGDELGHPRGLL